MRDEPKERLRRRLRPGPHSTLCKMETVKFNALALNEKNKTKQNKTKMKKKMNHRINK